MRKGQLIKKVLKEYKSHISFLQKDVYGMYIVELMDYLRSHKIDCGVCYFICEKIPKEYNSGYNARWVKSYYSDGECWGPYPTRGNNIKEVIKYLQLRVDIMEKELTKGDKLHQRVSSKNYLV
jgi:hypothetical protein